MRNIDRHATNLSSNDTQSVKEIYKNLNSNVAVSEIYIVPRDLDPDSIDPVTAAPELPMAMFDGSISDDAAYDPSKAEQVEIYEYRLLRRQNIWLAAHYPTKDTIQGLAVPVVGGNEVITCDNTDFEQSHRDTDRLGTIFSVPFYDADGRMKGSISAIIRTKALMALIPATDAALVNPAYGYRVLPAQAGSEVAASPTHPCCTRRRFRSSSTIPGPAGCSGSDCPTAGSCAGRSSRRCMCSNTAATGWCCSWPSSASRRSG